MQEIVRCKINNHNYRKFGEIYFTILRIQQILRTHFEYDVPWEDVLRDL